MVPNGIHYCLDHNCLYAKLSYMKVKVTNKLNLPRAFVEAIQNDPYDPDDGGTHSDYTITGLLKPPRMAQLQREHEVVEDAADRLYSLQGQVIHGIVERSKEALSAKGFLIEKRFYKEYTVDGKVYTVSAKIDVYDLIEARVSDYKYTSVASAKKGLKDEHKWQVNFQAELLRKAGYLVRTADACILMRDWSAEREYAGYPESPVMVHKVPLYTSLEIDQFVTERIRLHEAAKATLPICSDEERWSRPTFAVMKDPSDAKALRVFDTKVEAEAHIADKGPKGAGLIVVERPGKSVRCLRYCPVRSVCTQFKDMQPAADIDGDGFTKVS